jgi:hypothetical protein
MSQPITEPSSTHIDEQEKPSLLQVPSLEEDALEERFEKFYQEKNELEEPSPLEKKLQQTLFSLAAASPMPLHMDTPLISTEKIPASSLILSLFDAIETGCHKAHVNGDSITTLTLDSTLSPLFQGMEIVITEYSVAPKSFHVQINACAEVLALLQGGEGVLGHYVTERGKPFQIYRVDLALKLEEKKKYKVHKAQDNTDL